MSFKNFRNQRGFAPILVIIIVVIVGVLGFVGYRAWQSAQQKPEPTKQSEQSESQVVPPGYTQGDFYIIKLPEGWKKTSFGGDYPCPGPGQHFQSADGKQQFSVCTDPEPRGINADTLWHLTKNQAGDGFTITSEEPLCEMGSEGCTVGDNEFHALIKATDNEIDGVRYIFQAVDTTRETGVDLQMFRDMVTSFKDHY